MKKMFLLSSLVVCAVSAHAQSSLALFRCKDQSHPIELAVNNTGQVVEGPACAEITVNALRYGVDFGKTTTSSTGPNLTSIFPSSFSPGGADPKTIVAPSLEEKFQADEQILRVLSAQLILVESKNRTTGSNLDKYLVTLKNLITQTDDILVTGGATGVLAVVDDPAVKTQMD